MIADARAVLRRGLTLESLECRNLLTTALDGSYAEFASITNDARPGIVEAHAHWSVPFRGQNYFFISAAGGSNELWRTDGTNAGTELVKQVSPYPFDGRLIGGEFPECTCFDATLVNGDYLYFVVMTGEAPIIESVTGAADLELWRTDGTAQGTEHVRHLGVERTGNGSRHLNVDLYAHQGDVLTVVHEHTSYFDRSLVLDFEYDNVNWLEFASTDLVEFGDAQYFIAFTVLSDAPGTAYADARLFKADIKTHEIESIMVLPNRSCPDGCTLFDSTNELVSDWSLAGIVEFEGSMYIRGNSEDLKWQSDGTELGTVPVDLFPPELEWPRPSDPFDSPGSIVELGDATDGRPLVFDGDKILAGNEFFFDVPNPGQSDQPAKLVVVSQDSTSAVAYGTAAFSFDTSRYRQTDGSPDGNSEIPREVYDRLSANDPPPTSGLSQSKLNKLVSAAAVNDTPYHLGAYFFEEELQERSSQRETAAWNDSTFFVVYDPATGRQLWVTDGTEEGTELALDIGPSHAMPMSLAVAADKLFFVADDGIHGNEVWTLDLAAHAMAEASRSDIDGNGTVEFRDFLILSQNYLSESDEGIAAGDLDENGVIDFEDFLLLSMSYGQHGTPRNRGPAKIAPFE